MAEIKKIIIENHVEEIPMSEAMDFFQIAVAEGQGLDSHDYEVEFRLDGVCVKAVKEKNVDKLMLCLLK